MNNIESGFASGLLAGSLGDDVETESKTIFLVSPALLHICERSITIYGDTEERPDLEASIKKNGITTPLIVSKRTGHYEVVSGKCRLRIALKLGFDRVPIEIRDFATLLAELECLLVENLEREIKTNLQKIGEAEAWEEVESAHARERQRLGAYLTHQKLKRASPDGEKMLPENSPEACSGDTRDIVSARVGISSFTYRNGTKVKSYITQLRSTGCAKQADVLVGVLNKSVDAAYKLLKHDRRDDILRKIAADEAKDVKSAIALLASGRATSTPMLLREGIIVKPPPRHKDLAQSGGRIVKVKDATVNVAFRNMKTMRMEVYTYKHSEIPLLPEEEPSADVLARIDLLYAKPDLHPTHAQMLDILKQPVYLNPEELAVLEFFEQYYAARNALNTRDLLLLESHEKAELHAA